GLTAEKRTSGCGPSTLRHSGRSRLSSSVEWPCGTATIRPSLLALASTEKPPPASSVRNRGGPTSRTVGRAGSTRAGKIKRLPGPPVTHPPVFSSSGRVNFQSGPTDDKERLGGSKNVGRAESWRGSRADVSSSPLTTSKKLSQSAEDTASVRPSTCMTG